MSSLWLRARFERLERLASRHAVFLQLAAGFAAVVALVSAVGFAVSGSYLRRMEREVAAGAEERFHRSSAALDAAVSSLWRDIYTTTLEKLEPLIPAAGPEVYALVAIREHLGAVALRNPSLHEMALVVRGADYVVGVGGSYPSAEFFSRFYRSEGYTLGFWENEMRRGSGFRIHPARPFVTYQGPDRSTESWLVPLVFHRADRSDYLVIAFLDARALASTLDPHPSDRYHVWNGADVILAMGPGGALSGGLAAADAQEAAYSFARDSASIPLRYSAEVPTFFVRERLGRIGLVNGALLLACLLVALALSVLFASRFDAPMRRLADLVQGSGVAQGAAERGGGLGHLLAGVAGVVEQNRAFAARASSAQSVLRQVLLQAAAQDVGVTGSSLEPEIEKWFERSPRFAMVLFRVHFRAAPEVLGRAGHEMLLIVRELVARYVEDAFGRNLTFTAPRSSIVTVVDLSAREPDLRAAASRVLQALEREDAFACFTVVCSGPEEGVARLATVYRDLLARSRCRRLSPQSQLMPLAPDTATPSMSGSHLAGTTRAELEDLLASGDQEGAGRLVRDVLRRAAASGVTETGATLLATEVLSACETALAGSDRGEAFHADAFYRRIAECDSESELADCCADMVRACGVPKGSPEASGDRIVEYATEYLRTHYAEIISFETIARDLHITRTYLSTYFKRKCGIGLNDFLRQLRLERAAELLQGGDLKVQEVAARVGIPETTTFARVFRRFTGRSPTAYRRRLATRKGPSGGARTTRA